MSSLTYVTQSQYMTYLKLKHPAVEDGAAYDVVKHKMNDFVCGTAYKNKPWIVAQFEDLSKWAYYYDETAARMLPVKALRDGLVLDGLTSLDNVAAHIKRMLDTVPDLSIAEVATQPDGSKMIDIKGAYGNPLSVDISATDSSGNTASGRDLVINSFPESAGTSGVQATAVIMVMAVSEGGKIAQIEAGNDIDGWINIANLNCVTVGAADTTSTIATAIAAAINAYSPVGGKDYTAEAIDNTVRVYASVSLGAGANTYEVRITVAPETGADGSIVFTNCGFLVKGTGSETATVTINGVVVATGITRVGTDTAWAVAIATAINTSTDYTAVQIGSASGGFFIVGKKVTNSADTTINDEATALDVTVDVSAGSVEALDYVDETPADPNKLVVTLSVLEVYMPIVVITIREGYRQEGPTTPGITVSITGGSGQYKSTWTRHSGNYSITVYDPTVMNNPYFLWAGGQLQHQFPINMAIMRVDVEDQNNTKLRGEAFVNVVGIKG